MHPLDRRAFLASSLSLAAAAPLVFAAEGKAPALPIVDTHQHLWDLKKFRLNWIKKGSLLDRSYVQKDYAEAVKGLGVVQAVYMEVDVDPSQQVAEAEHLIAICKKGDTLTKAAVISGRPASEDFAKYIKRFKDSPYIKGVRQVLHGEATKAGYCLQKQFIKSVQLLGELGMRFDLCMRPGELPDATKLIDACPDTRFILDHCGNADLKKHEQWKKDIAELAKRKNVVGKVSGIVAQATPGKWTADDLAPVIKHTLSVFGPDRVMFGGDWPVCLLGATYAQWVKALKEIVADRKAVEQRKLFHDNAVKFYGLSPKAKGKR
jgi:predicted TIM-barrel fold metal-dependent hydrolase